jgi:hypothetical protein
MRAHHKLEKLQRWWPDVKGTAAWTLPVGIGDQGYLMVVCRDQQTADDLKARSNQIAIAINQKADEEGFVVRVVPLVTPNETDQGLFMLVDALLARMQELSEDVHTLKMRDG